MIEDRHESPRVLKRWHHQVSVRLACVVYAKYLLGVCQATPDICHPTSSSCDQYYYPIARYGHVPRHIASIQ